MNKEVYIVAARRTPVGSFQGQFSTTPATDLGAHVIKACLESTNLNPSLVDECIMGQVLTAGAGQAPARQSALKAGLPSSVTCMTINKVCGSGLKAVMLGAESIQLENAKIVVAGGQENMSLSPHFLKNSRNGFRMGHTELTDSMIHDGLWDPYNHFHMGSAAELCVQEYKFSREEQDEFAKQSYEWALRAQTQSYFDNEISPIEVEVRKQKILFTKDEEPGNANFEKMSSLRPAFAREGCITAANASKINDGAAAVILANNESALSMNLKPLAKIKGAATFAQDPKWFTTAPVGAIKKVLEKTQLKVNDIDLWEINEAFSAVTMAAMKDLDIPREKVNIHGGAVAIGHPIGASGARILTTLIHALHTHNKKLGLATLCIGGGEAVAVVVEKV